MYYFRKKYFKKCFSQGGRKLKRVITKQTLLTSIQIFEHVGIEGDKKTKDVE